MKRISVTLLVCFLSAVCHAQPSDVFFGHKYLVPFMPNGVASETSHATIEIVCGPDSAIVGISCRAYPGKGLSMTLAPYQHVRVPLLDEFNPIMDTVFEEVTDKMVLVSSTGPVSCYALHSESYRQLDSYQAIPMWAAGKHHRVISYIADSFNGWHGSRFSVAAFEEETEIEIRLSANTIKGTTAGSVMRYTLGQGQAVAIASPRNYEPDLTGTEIVSSKPVAVHSSHYAANVLVFREGGMNPGSSYAALNETTPPIEHWGKRHYLCSDTISYNGYFVRVVASEDNTSLRVNGDSWGTPLGAGQYRDTLVLRQVWEDPSERLRWPILIESDKPVLVANFNQTGLGNEHMAGDNAYLAIVPPMEHSSNDLQFISMKTDTEEEVNLFHYVTVITDDAAISTLSLDGDPIDKAHFRKLPSASNGRDYSIALLKVAEGAHRVTTEAVAEHGFVLMVTGHGHFWRSYGYGVGAYSKDIKSGVARTQADARDFKLSVHPNPTQDKVTIEWEARVAGAVKLEVYSVAGVLVHGEEILASAKPITLDTRSWPSGAYSIVLRSGDEEARGSVIKQ